MPAEALVAKARRGCVRLARFNRMQWRAFAASLVLVPLVRLSLRRHGFGATAARLARRSDGRARPAAVTDARAIADAVGLVAAQSLVGDACLGRSLVTWYLLRRRGMDAVIVIGAEPRETGFGAHAWVEYRDVVVNDSSDIRERFGSFGVELPRLG